MKRFLGVVCILLLLGGSAHAQTADQPLRGGVYYPQGSAAAAASFAFRYRLPQFPAEQPQQQALNRYFSDYAAELIASVIPDTVYALDTLPAAGEPAYYVDLDYEIPSSTADRLSVLLVSQRFLGNAVEERWESVVFALTGIYAGEPITLSKAMGLEQADGDADYASELVYGLVWQIVRYEIGAMQKAYFPDLTEADVRRAFTPQSDFYFDEDGNFVFFIQAGVIAGEVEGVLTYPFSMAELLSAVAPQ